MIECQEEGCTAEATFERWVTVDDQVEQTAYCHAHAVANGELDA